MDYKFVILMSVLSILNGCNSHTTHTGRTCPDVQPFPNLSLDKVLGVWYVVYAFDTSNTCLVWNITKVDDLSFKVTESRQLSVLDTFKIDHKHDLTATLDVPNPEVPAKMRIRWPTSFSGKADFIVFDTDYKDYMAVFECDRAFIIHRRNVAILSRASVMDQMFVDRIRRKLDGFSVPHDALEIVDQNVCREKSRYNWHMEGELFGLIKPDSPMTEQQRVKSGVFNYDESELETFDVDQKPDEQIKTFNKNL